MKKAKNVIQPIQKPIRLVGNWCLQVWDGVSRKDYRRLLQLRQALALSQENEANLTQQLEQAIRQCNELQQALDASKQQFSELWQELGELVADNDGEIQALRADLANHASALASCQSDLAKTYNASAVPIPHPEVLPTINLANWKLAFVGGHDATRRVVVEILHTDHGLIHKPVEIPPHRDASTSQKQLKQKLADCDLIVSIIGYSNHALTKSLQQLKDKNALKGDILTPNSRGASGVVRDILSFVTAQADPA
ncbi:hypothetical protein [Leptothoe sp. PORK10 BA2]|uniref:hypothetical protein n=1 Tax=Leptothoe sp. PORK10 BA2 TaxID=3110254 RepID=UPI002B1FBCB5|nr:hypothetical protein [Leptothoe sp. PORK10 BA2]MEA5466865.1 hypothetical protein [Leptothoe sp. PORK10 BA2]